MKERPITGEYPEWFNNYLGLVPEGDIVETLRSECKKTKDMMDALNDEKGDYRYAPGKWSLKEVVGHMADFERVMGYRLLCISRGDQANLPGFDEGAYIDNSAYAGSTLRDIIEEFAALRLANVNLLNRLREQDWSKTGTAVGHTTSVRALAWVLGGHEIHHRRVIAERYL